MDLYRKLWLERLLMILSIVLLIVLEAYWLRNAYREEYRRLKKDVSVDLRVAVMQEQVKKIVNARGNFDIKARNGNAADNISIIAPGIDSLVATTGIMLKRAVSDTPVKANIRIMVGTDSGETPGLPRIFTFEQERNNFDEEDPGELSAEFPAGPRTIDMDSIARNYKASLDEAGIHLAFVLKKIPDSLLGHRNRNIKIGRFEKDGPGRVRHFNSRAEMIQATFENPFWFLVSKIRWQLFFGLLMFAVTTASFIFLFRNLLQQQRLADMKSELISNITHELKTPIATVSVAIEALKNFDAIQDAAKTKTYLDISSGELQRLNLLVDRVLKLSLFEQKQINLQFETVDMQQLLHEVLNSLKLQFEKHSAVVNFTIKGSDLITRGDRLHLIGVFYNLLDNALKYSPAGPVINVNIEKPGKNIVINIADNGIGIPEAYRKKIFDKFFRVPHGDTHNIKGYGLGLSYVCEVIRLHGGSIDVMPNGNKGTVFTVELPEAAGT